MLEDEEELVEAMDKDNMTMGVGEWWWCWSEREVRERGL